MKDLHLIKLDHLWRKIDSEMWTFPGSEINVQLACGMKNSVLSNWKKKKKNCKPLQFLKTWNQDSGDVDTKPGCSSCQNIYAKYSALPFPFFSISALCLFFFPPNELAICLWDGGGESAPSWSAWSLAGRCQLPRSVSKLGRHQPSIMEHAATLPAQQRSTSGMSRAVVTLRLGQIASTWYISSRAIQPVSLVRGTWHEDGWIIHTHNRPLCPAAKPGPTVILVHNW